MKLRRRQLMQLGLGLAPALLVGCATTAADGLRQADIVLLGERHDNPAHHRLRGQWLYSLRGSSAVVVAEHLTLGRQVDAAAAAQDLLPALQAAGFDARGWAWPLHRPLFEPLFSPVLAAGLTPKLPPSLPLWGGNLPREAARDIARRGEAAWDEHLGPTLAQRLRDAPLPPPAQAALDQALIDGHCGQLPAARVPAMRAAQRARDAAMAQALLQAHAAGARPVVLVAGNGHVRRDHGVPQLLAAWAPGLTVVSVVLDEQGAGPEVLAAAGPADVRWTTPGVPSRNDPCAGMTLPAGAPPSAAGAASGPR